MDYNYHAHTPRCSHATGTEESYIEAAIAGGIRYMGFSDHVPLKYDDGYEVFYRVPDALGKEYCDTIKALSKKYEDKIEISVGFEMEYFPQYFDKMLNDAKKYGAEYLILGQHSIGPEYPDPIYTTVPTDSEEKLSEYVEAVVGGIKSGVFTYAAHPDMFFFTGDKDIYRKEMQKICVAAKEEDIPLEINFLGIRDKRHYPREDFWQIAAEETSPVTFGFDAHDVNGAADLESLKTAEELVQKYNLNYIGKPKLIKIK